MLDVGSCGLVRPLQPQCFFQSEALALAEQVSSGSHDLWCWQWLAPEVTRRTLLKSTLAILQRLTKLSSDLWGPWKYTISFCWTIWKFSASSSCSPNLPRIVAGVCCISGRAHELKYQSPPPRPTHLWSYLLSLWDLLCWEVELQFLDDKILWKSWCIDSCWPVHPRCMFHIAWISGGQLTAKGDFFCVFN